MNVLVIAQMAAAAGDEDAEFALVVGTLRNFWAQDGAAGREQGAGRLHENERFDGNFVAEFGGVLTIIAPDADDL